ncbi:DNA-directed DNA polymerase [Agaricicola taiwanensis]|uniref:DNA polymerase III subunit alpha n=1 Tax=Agaricicola taiwanensis TaxID=591372 RepID=A0A8J2YI56_9RHOB|nr:DNA polymerase III subunit alpha [Agaricicola taiwanensis]GGE44306.1 DNA-directed DNA polymerase [Agaricicola taiwanensis]
MARGPGFVHLHVHSAYSLLEGALPIKKLSALASADRMPALALTDTNNLFGALEFSETLAKAGIQPILGTSLTVEFGDREERPGQRLEARPRLVLLARNEAGWVNLMALSSIAFLETDPSDGVHVPISRLADHSEGLIALTGGPLGTLDGLLRQNRSELASARLETMSRMFGDALYIEIQRHNDPSEVPVEQALLDMAYQRGIPLVATNESYFPKNSDHEAHDALLAISEGRYVAEADRRQVTAEHAFLSREEMVRKFSDLPEATDNTIEIAQRCVYRLKTRKPILPRFTTADGVAADEAEELKRQAREGLAMRLAAHGLAPDVTEAEYQARLEYELGIIEKMQFPGYFLIVADFIKWAKDQNIPVGPGRGSGAGSVVAWALTITDLDPIRFGLLFERFLNPERVSMPDFDIDFCQERREEVIRYVQERYGQDRVAQIITFGTLQARGVLRDVGRVLEMPYGQVDKLCKLVPQNPANPVTLAQAINDEPRLKEAREEEPVVARLLDIALKLEGLYRHASTHAAGIVIGDRPLQQLVPLYRDPRSDMPVTQFNMKWVEQAGLVKFDFLGLKTLTTLTKAVDLVKRRGIDINLSALPLDDKPAYEIMSRGETVGVFQVESAGMRRALVDMKPDRLEDIIALVALYRPGPMANIPTYCARKHGRERPEYPHPKIEPALEETFGVIIYQEQVMRIAQELAGYSLGEADLLRRAMGKKIKAEMAAQSERFVSGAMKNGVDRAQAETIFELLAKFADYGFNKSHAAAYALVAYQTAYMKANYPVEFLAASMTLDMGNTDKLAEFRQEANRLGIQVLPPSVNHSAVEFEVDNGAIRYALGAVKGVGVPAAAAIVAARDGTSFRGLSDFACRIDGRAVGKKALESLVQAGAFDELEPDRARVFSGIEQITAMAQRTSQAATIGQNDFFASQMDGEPIRLAAVEPWLPWDRLAREYDAVGFFLSGHPLDAYAGVMKRLRVQRWAEFVTSVKAGATAGKLAATVVGRQERRTKSGTKMGIVRLSDPSGHYEAVLFSEGLNDYRDLLEPNSAILVTLSAALDGEDVRARIQHIEPLDKAAAAQGGGNLRIFLRDPVVFEGVQKHLSKGDSEVNVVMLIDEGQTEVEIKLPGKFRVTPPLIGAIKAIPGIVEVTDG